MSLGTLVKDEHRDSALYQTGLGDAPVDVLKIEESLHIPIH